MILNFFRATSKRTFCKAGKLNQCMLRYNRYSMEKNSNLLFLISETSRCLKNVQYMFYYSPSAVQFKLSQHFIL